MLVKDQWWSERREFVRRSKADNILFQNVCFTFSLLNFSFVIISSGKFYFVLLIFWLGKSWDECRLFDFLYIYDRYRIREYIYWIYFHLQVPDFFLSFFFRWRLLFSCAKWMSPNFWWRHQFFDSIDVRYNVFIFSFQEETKVISVPDRHRRLETIFENGMSFIFVLLFRCV